MMYLVLTKHFKHMLLRLFKSQHPLYPRDMCVIPLKQVTHFMEYLTAVHRPVFKTALRGSTQFEVLYVSSVILNERGVGSTCI